VVALTAKVSAEEAALKQADSVAQAAMEAAEEAVRAEMECIAVTRCACGWVGEWVGG
jgi:hypothetical protein